MIAAYRARVSSVATRAAPGVRKNFRTRVTPRAAPAYRPIKTVDCAEIRQGFKGGGVPSGPSVDRHLKQCPHCAELFGHSATLGHRLAIAEPPVLGNLNEQLVLTESLIAHERGLRAYLRSRPTWLRWAWSLMVPGLLLVRELLRHRVPLHQLGAIRIVTGSVLLGALGLVVLSALRPLPLNPRRALPRSLLAMVAWCLPCLLWLAPEASAATEDFSRGDFALRSLTCFGYGTALAAPSVALLWAFDRSERIRFRVGALGAGLAALLASLLLLLHCPSTQRAHLLAGHFSIGLVWFVVVSIAAGFRAR